MKDTIFEAAIALAQSGFDVKVIEKRPQRPVGHGRKNMVALRPEALRQLESLGALKYALKSNSKDGDLGCITRMTEGKTTSEIDGSVFEWPLKRYPGAEPEYRTGNKQNRYEIPSKITEQVPSSFINLGDLEDCLAQAAVEHAVSITYDTTLVIGQSSKTFTATVVTSAGVINDLGRPDLIVCASGKNDHSLTSEIGINRIPCAVLTDADLTPTQKPETPFDLHLRDDASEDLESQLYSVFVIQDPSLRMGTLEHLNRKYISSPYNIPQPVVEIQMNHATAAHSILQHPRSEPPLSANQKNLEAFILGRLNARLGTSYSSIQHLKDSGNLVWGDPLTPITVETVTASQFVYGDNVILVGDCAMSCSPASGIGADIGMTVDSQSVRVLADALKDARGDQEKKREALMQFNLRKAESAVIWSQKSRMFYLTRREANEVLERQRTESCNSHD
ncbi:hypothetical protein OHC33_010198 [Knufia fluminis]|uniref:Uncharacterized protein n=1 Tax=Knufia fluminis TaxID=191047 RepID=A0AAN8E9W1_9EURO|nr:hypothetical protein OHC33_010198 [Knufia fluminis]